MKKLLAIVLTLMLAVTMFAGCGTEEANNTANEKDTLVCGVTIFENMNEQEADGTWTGFETEFAQEVGKIIGMDVDFQVIDWSQKYNELNSGAIDCVWNGFTANSSDEVNGAKVKRSDLVDFSYGYMLNQQCVVTKAENAAKITSEADLKGKTACVEGGSAGASYASTVTDADKIYSTTAQINAFSEVKSGAVDFAVVDIILAKNICGNGDFKDLVIVETITGTEEFYAIGFKKGSELTAKVNKALEELAADGTIAALAAKYGVSNTVITDFSDQKQ